MGGETRTNKVDVFRLHLGQYDQAIMTGNEVYQRLAGSYDPAGRMDAQIGDGARLGRANYGSGEDVSCRLNTLNQLQDLGLSVAQALGDFALIVAIELEDRRL